MKEAGAFVSVSYIPEFSVRESVSVNTQDTEHRAVGLFFGDVTIAAGGFFGPQGRELRIPLADPKQNEKIEKFEYNDYRITNFEMESSALAGLARLMGHKAMTVCMVIANRLIKEANTGYKNSIDGLIEKVLERI